MSAPGFPIPVTARPRSGANFWLASYRQMVRYDFVSQRQSIAFLLIIQLLLSAGMAILYGFYLPVIPERLAVFIVTGTPALALIPIGFIMVPSLIAERKLAGTYEFTLAFPVPRMAGVAATATVYTLLALPGLVLALVLAAWRYDVTLHVSPLIVPAILLTAVAASCTGAALGHAIPNPVITTLVTNLLVFFVLLYSPIVFPAEQYPHWLVVINDVLPFSNMATIIRDALSDGLVHDVGRAYAIVLGWTIVSVVVSHHVVSRRG